MPAVSRKGDSLSTGHGCVSTTTLDTPGQGSVFANNILVARIGDPTVSHPNPPIPICPNHVANVNAGSPNVYVVGIKVGRDDIHKQYGLPIRTTINGLIEKGIPIAIAGIHDYENEDKDDGITYQHTHILFYNIHHYLPNNNKQLASCINRVGATQGRYVGKKFRRDGVDVRPVGTYKHYLEHELEDTNYHDYLNIPLNSPRRDCLMNYMANNRHNPDVHYDLTYLYYDEDYLPLNLYNRTILTT